MSDCNVCLGSEPEGYCEFYLETEPKSRKEHKCEECNRVIPAGHKYRKTVMRYEGDFSAWKTCLDCEALREAFSCGGNVIPIGELWEQIGEYLFPDMTTGCLEKVSSASAKAYLVKRWNDWKFGQVRP